MSLHIQRFVDRVRGLESRGAREFSMPMQEAKDLHADITRLLITLQTLQDSQKTLQTDDQAVEVKITGGTFR
jgi:hypothetical protein